MTTGSPILQTLIAAALVMATVTQAHALTQQLGARGQVQRMVVNHNANSDEIYVTATGAGNLCSAVTLRSNDPNVSPTSYKTLYAYLLTAKMTSKTLEFYTDTACNLFRLEIVE